MPTDDVDEELLDRLRRVLEPLGAAESASRLTGGLFATTYAVTMADGSRVVVKTAPVDGDRLLTHEHGLLPAEAEVYRLAADRPGLLMPRLLHFDDSRAVLPGDALVASHLDGVPWDRAGFGPPAEDARTARARHELGVLMARVHTVVGTRFGYVANVSGLGAPTWPEAFGRIIAALLSDARRWGVELPEDEVRGTLVRHHDALAEVTRPVLVHGDLWPGNLFVDPVTGELLGVIDPERALWADPLMELIGADQVGENTIADDLLEGYGAGGGVLDVSSASAITRLALYRMHMSMIWLIEATPRGFDGDFGTWYRRTASANLRTALDQLA